MAQPARRLDETGAAANLRRSQVAARRQKELPQKRGQVLEFPGGRSLSSGAAASGSRPVGTQLREAEVYNFPTTAEQRALQEAQNRERWNRDKMQARQNHLDFLQAPREYRELSREMREEPEMMAAYQEYRAEAASIVTQDRLTSSEFRERQMTIRRLSEASRKLSEQIQRVRAIVQKVKDGKDFAFTAYEIGSLAESEGAMAETVNVSGIFISLYRGIKTVIMPQAALSNDPDAGQFFKGFLSFAEPTVFQFRKVSGILGAAHGMYGYLLLFLLLAMFLGIFVIIAALLLTMNSVTGLIGAAVSSVTG